MVAASGSAGRRLSRSGAWDPSRVETDASGGKSGLGCQVRHASTGWDDHASHYIRPGVGRHAVYRQGVCLEMGTIRGGCGFRRVLCASAE